MASPVSQKHIAELAGVDQSTVSNVLRGRGVVAEPTRERVLQLVRELRYTPNAHARGLRTQESPVIGMVTGPVSHGYHALLVDALLERLAAQGRPLLLRYVDPQASDEKRRQQIRGLLDRQAGGVLVATTDASLRPELEEVAGSGIPLVLVGSSAGTLPFVSCDRSAAAHAAALHLAERGGRRLAALLHPAPGVDPMQDKAAGFRAGAAEAGVAEPVLVALPAGQEMCAAGETLGRDLLQRHPQVDAVFCETDEVALGLLTAAAALGRRVPADLQVLGFDDLPLARHAAVPLSTIHQPVDRIASEALALLDGQMRGGRVPTRRKRDRSAAAPAGVVPFELIARASTGRHAGGHGG